MYLFKKKQQLFHGKILAMCHCVPITDLKTIISFFFICFISLYSKMYFYLGCQASILTLASSCDKGKEAGVT